MRNKRKILLALVVIAIAVSASNQVFAQGEKVSGNKKAQELFIEGKIAELKFNFYEALEDYKTALKYDKSPGIYNAISELYFNLGKYTSAISNINKALKYDKKNIKYLEHKADIYLAMQKLPLNFYLQ